MMYGAMCVPVVDHQAQDLINTLQTQPVVSWDTQMLPAIAQTLKALKARCGWMASPVGARHLVIASIDAFPSPPLLSLSVVALTTLSILSVHLIFHSETRLRLETLFYVGNRPRVSAVDLVEGVKQVIIYQEELLLGSLLGCVLLGVFWCP